MNHTEPKGEFYDIEYFVALEYRVFSGAHGSRTRNIMEAIGPVKGLTILDVGAGGGAFAELMREKGARVHAIDYSPFTPEFIRLRFPGVTAAQASVYDITDQNKYDVITLLDVIEHCADQDRAIKNCVCALKSGGKLVISTDADLGPYSKGFLRRAYTWFEKFSEEGIMYRGIKRAEARRKKYKNYHDSHIGELSPQALIDTVNRNGLKIVEHRIYPTVGAPIRDFFLRFLPKRYRGDHQTIVAVKS